MDKAVLLMFSSEALNNNYCIDKPFYWTASTVNLQVLYSTSKIYTLWPDLLDGTEPPEDVVKIAKDANRFYPAPGDKLFQVKITEEFAGMKDGKGHDTKNHEFNKRFKEIADTSKYELVFFVGRVDAQQVAYFLKNGTNMKRRLVEESGVEAVEA